MNIDIFDFIKDYSFQNEAELIIQTRNNNLDVRNLFGINKIFSWLRKFYIYYVSNPNDIEVENAFKYMKKKWGNNSSQTVIAYLRDKFSQDHLRKFEYAFLAKCLIRSDVKKNIIVDMGGGFSYSTITPVLLRLHKSKIFSIDVLDYPRKSKYGIKYITGDCTNTNLPNNFADAVTLISTLEHIGLGRYGDPMDIIGDIKTMQEVKRILKSGGHAIITIPYGYPTVVFNLHRVYDSGRIKKLTNGFKIIRKEYTLLGKASNRRDASGKHVTKYIPGYYENIPVRNRNYDAQGGIMLLLQKI